jgi:hypothetical protein
MKLQVIVSFAIALVLGTACGKADSNIQSHAGVEIKLLSCKRVKEFASGTQRARPKQQGDELAIASLEFKGSSSAKQLKLSAGEIEIEDTQGQKYPTDLEELSFTFGDGGNVIPMEVFFAVPEKAQLKRLRLGSALFNLERLPVDQGAQKTP